MQRALIVYLLSGLRRIRLRSMLDRPALAYRPVHEVESFRNVDEARRILVGWKGFPQSSDYTWGYEDDLRHDIQPSELFEGLLLDLMETSLVQPSWVHSIVMPEKILKFMRRLWDLLIEPIYETIKPHYV